MSATETVDVTEAAFTYAGKDSKPIAAYRWESGRRRATRLQIAHGMAEHAAALRPASRARRWPHGAVVYANDHRAPRATTAGSIEAAAATLKTPTTAMPADAAIGSPARIRAAAGRREVVILLGHSRMGSFIGPGQYVLSAMPT